MDNPGESKLSSWKEITKYLGYSERTCRRLEKENGLPIYRLDGGANSRVFAYKPELDAWFRQGGNRAAALAEAPKAKKKAVGTAAWHFAGAVLALILSFGVILRATSRDSKAADFGIDGSVLRILNKEKRELGRFDTGLPGLEKEELYRERFPVRTLNEENIVKWPIILIADINNDKQPEVVFSTQTKSGYGEGRLYCLDKRGKKLWEFTAGSRRIYGEELISADYMIEGIGAFDMNGDGSLEIYVISAHVDDPPTQLAVLDAAGSMIGEYWNYGRLIDMAAADINSDGRPELLVVGTNNEYGNACLIAFDPRHIRGGSPQMDEKYICRDLEPGTELVHMLFPRTAVDLAEFPERESMRLINIMADGRIKTMTIHGCLHFELDRTLAIEAVKPTAVYQQKYGQLLREGRLGAGEGDGDLSSLKDQALYWNGKQWTPHPR